jgi:hypothetical protein
VPSLTCPSDGNVLETYLQRAYGILPEVETGASPSEALGGALEMPPSRDDEGHMTTITRRHRRIAYCECGARLAGDSEQELFDAAQRHLAHHHPRLLGALGREMVMQMAEDVGGH